MTDEALLAFAKTRSTKSDWRINGLPWEVGGPLLLSQVEHASHSTTDGADFIGEGAGGAMHEYATVQQRVLEVFRRKNRKDREAERIWRTIVTLTEELDATPSDAAAPPSNSAVRKRRA